MINHAVIQGSQEWDAVRCGKFTASNIYKLFMKKNTAGYNEYINQIVFERLTGQKPEDFKNEWMERGIELEAEAIAAYEHLTFDKVVPAGFVELDEWRGCSPDGLIGADGMVQIKCVKWSTLFDFKMSKKVPSNYMFQVQFEMFITSRKWNDLFYYHPLLKPVVNRVEWDNLFKDIFEREIDLAKIEVMNRLEKLKELKKDENV